MSLIKYTTEQVGKLVQNETYVLVDVKAPWCAQCSPQEKVVERVAERFEGQVAFGAVDLASNNEFADKYEIKSLPTLLLFENGELASSLTGMSKAHVVTEALQDLIAQRGQVK